MTSLADHSNRRRRGGFTFVEIVVALGVLLLFSASALTALTQYNRYATASRLRAHALAEAQEKIDEVLTASWSVDRTRPTVLNAGTTTENDVVLNADATNSQDILKSDFTALVAPVTATRMTKITDVGTRLLRADVTVTFTFAKRTYTITLSTMRTTDTI